MRNRKVTLKQHLMDELKRQYKAETGKNPDDNYGTGKRAQEVQDIKNNLDGILEEFDQRIAEALSEIPSKEYVNWLENKLILG